MSRSVRIALTVLCVFTVSSTPSFAARSGSEGMLQFRGDWHPVVGAGAVYQMETKGRPPLSMEIAVVGQEAGGYWIENRMNGPQEMISKMLVTPAGPQRMIVKAAGQPAMELPVNLQAVQAPQTDLKQTAKLVGKEQITTPAGTFACDHYQMNERGGTVDAWVASSVSPYGLVKMTSRDMTMTLAQVVKGAKSRITETPQKMEMPGMPNLSELMGGRKE